MKFSSLILIMAVAALFASCKDESTAKGKKNLIDPSTLVHNPRTIDGIPPEEAARLPILTFQDTTHSFGTISEGERVTYDFTFTNTGKSPLLIESAQGSCGCTVADYPKEPLAPGKSAVMKIVFSSAGKQGHQEKNIAINANTARGLQNLYIQADVTPQSK